MFKDISTSVSIAASLVVTASALALVASVPSAHATSSHTTIACVDGSKRANLSVKWNANDSITFTTINGKTLCNDVTLYFSSYTMPDNYNGKPFTGNATAVPQTVFDSSSYVMKKSTTGASTLTVDLPEACKNIQVDLYYAPEITGVTAEGHGNQYISGKIIEKTVDGCTPATPEEPETPVTPAVPTEEAQTPPTPAPQVTLPAPAPAELPHTGSEAVLPVAIATIVGAMSYAGSMLFKRQ